MRQAAAALGPRLVRCDEPESRREYAALLASADVAVSTARSEFFGLAMIEASYAGCFPLVPDRLAYPEIYPGAMRYDTPEALAARLRAFIAERPARGQGREVAERFTIGALLPEWRAAFERLAAIAR